MTAREDILSRIRTALPGDSSTAGASHAAIVRAYERHGERSEIDRIEMLLDRLRDYDAEILEASREEDIAAAIGQSLTSHKETRAIAAQEFPAAWTPPGVLRDDALSVAEIESMQAALTACEVAIASTGTIVLVHAGAQGRRLLTLLPDHHICVLRRAQIVEAVPEAFALPALHTTRPVTTISGPSATSDIEMTRIRGVHGPRRLTVILTP